MTGLSPDDVHRLVAVVRAAADLSRNLTRVYGRQLTGHDLPTTSAAVALRLALAAVPVAALYADEEVAP